MKYFIVIVMSVLILTGCDKKEKRTSYKMDKKFCVAACIKTEFEMFHTKGESWGTSSSSMSSIGQSDIYTAVKKSCSEFYKNVTCCEWNYKYNNSRNIETVHGYDYGQCR
jgi:uncharacterized lipoprotein YehR (DUF1307 family)